MTLSLLKAHYSTAVFFGWLALIYRTTRAAWLTPFQAMEEEYHQISDAFGGIALASDAHLGREFEHTMISQLKRITRQLRRSKPGRRFVDHYHQTKHKKKNAWKRWLVIILGVVMAIAGLILSLPPAMPGFLLWIPGLALVASQVKAVAVMLDKLECAARTLYHRMAKRFSGRRD